MSTDQRYNIISNNRCSFVAAKSITGHPIIRFMQLHFNYSAEHVLASCMMTEYGTKTSNSGGTVACSHR